MCVRTCACFSTLPVTVPGLLLCVSVVRYVSSARSNAASEWFSRSNASTAAAVDTKVRGPWLVIGLGSAKALA